MTSVPSEPNLGLLANIPDQDLEDIVAAIKAGAKDPAAALGFTDSALDAIENMALSFYQAKDYKKASVICGFVLQMRPKRASAWRALGACCQALKRYATAVYCYQAAAEADPEDLPSRVLMGECMCQSGAKETGLSLLQAAVKRGTKNPAYAPYITRARALISAKGGLPNRLVLMKEGQKLVSESNVPPVWDPTVDPNREITAADIQKNPKLNQLMTEIAMALESGRLTYAQVGGFTATELDGAYACACKYAEMGQVLQAIQISGYLMFLDPYNPRYYQLVGICLQRMKQYENADFYYKTAIAFKPDPMTLVYRGECKIMAGLIDEGLKLIKEGVEMAGNDPAHTEIVERAKILQKQFKNS